MVDDARGAHQKVRGKNPVLTPHVAREPTQGASEGSIDLQERTVVGNPEVILKPQVSWKKSPTPEESCDRRLTHYPPAGPHAPDLLRVIN
jgi:hypothetical protein